MWITIEEAAQLSGRSKRWIQLLALNYKRGEKPSIKSQQFGTGGTSPYQIDKAAAEKLRPNVHQNGNQPSKKTARAV